MAELLTSPTLDSLLRWARDYSALLVPAVAIGIGLLFLLTPFGNRRGSRADRDSLLSRAGNTLARAFTTNWQLTLLATTAFVLSCASGWTTWDGMRNFTGEPVLSLMVTFGIQGVMLIIAWIIGESFASGMNQRTRSRDSNARAGVWSKIEPAIGLAVGSLFALSLMTAIANALGAFDSGVTGAAGRPALLSLADKALYVGVGLLLIATLLINHRSEIAQPYVQSARIIAKNAVLWVMFLSCMATSVFFSFDSLFTSIFPPSERKRAADIRAVNQVAGVVADIGALMQQRQGEEAEGLFRTDGWKRYDDNLARLAKESQGAERVIEDYFVQLMEARRRAIAEQQERISTAMSGQAGLISKKTTLTDELSRIRGERPELAGNLAKVKSELEDRARALDSKRIEAQAEEKGAEGTLKTGRGPQWRERMAEMTRMQEAYKIQEERVRDAQKRLGAVDQRIAQIERELAGIDGDIAKLKGEAQTAEARIKASEQTTSGEEGPKVDPARVRVAFERARAEFQQEPTVDKLNVLSQQCSQLLTAMTATPTTKERVRSIDCDSKPAAEAASHIFALNAGVEAFSKNCVGGDKLPQTGGTDALLSFGRKCLQDSGLPSKDSAVMSAKLSTIDLTRDDKAHRFVVTWNAFQDGNRLAYLALAIAIAIDSLVFMSGLFGANAIRSPLTDLEGRSDMTAEQLEAAIDHTVAQTPHPRATLAALLRSMHPIEGEPGYSSEIVLDPREALVDEMRTVLVAGSTIGAVRRVGNDRSRYLVSTGLARYFAVAQRKPWKVNASEVSRKELISVVGVALMPDPQGNAEFVLSELHPISDLPGYAAETYPFRIAEQRERRLMLNVLGAGATVEGAVQRHGKDDGRYFVSTDLYKTLLMMSAGAFPAYVSDPRTIADVRDRKAAVRALRSENLAPRQLSMDDGEQQRLPAPQGYEPSDPPSHEDLRGQDGPAGGEASWRGHVSDGPGNAPAASVERPSGSYQPHHPPQIPLAGEPPRPRKSDSRPRGGAEHESSLRNQVRDELIQLGGLFPWDARDVAIAAKLGENSAPELALARLPSRAPILGERITNVINDCKNAVLGAYDELRARHETEPLYLQVLETVAGELVNLMPLLILAPKGPYQQELEYVVAVLEPQNGEGVLSASDQIVLARAKQQIDALNRLSDDDRERLNRVGRIIDQYNEQVGSTESAQR